MAALRPILASVALALAALPGATQSTWHVDINGTPPGSGTAGDPYTSIQYAIDQPATLDGDTVLVEPGTYDETIDYSGKTLSVLSTGGAAATTLDGKWGYGTCVTLDSGEGPLARLEGFTVIHGSGSYSGGGGIFLSGTSPTIADCVVRDNFADRGAGIYSLGGSPTIVDCVLRDNDGEFGGGLYAQGGAPRLERCTFIDNGDPGWAEEGAGVYIYGGSPTFEDCTFTGHKAYWGGGLYAYSGTLTLDGCRFDSNLSIHDGGGAYFRNASATITDCVFDRNWPSIGRGGGFFVESGSTVDATGTTLSRNNAIDDGAGGGAYVAAGASLTFTDGNIFGNRSVLGGGVAAFGTLRMERTTILDNDVRTWNYSNPAKGAGVYFAPSGGATAELVRCVIVGNSAYLEDPPTEGGGVFGPVLLENCNVLANVADVAGGACGATLLNTIHRGNLPPALCSAPSVTYSNVEGGAAGVGNIDQPPMFWDEVGRDYNLLLGSPCIDSGDPGSPLDPDGSRADMGAFPHDGGYARTYCQAGVSGDGCVPAIIARGEASATAPAGFVLVVKDVAGQRNGLFFYGVNGRQANPWGNGTSFQCVVPPVNRASVVTSTGTAGACDGILSSDLNARWCSVCPRPSHNPGAGAIVCAQAWYRDPHNTSNQTTSLSNAIEFQVQP